MTFTCGLIDWCLTPTLAVFQLCCDVCLRIQNNNIDVQDKTNDDKTKRRDWTSPADISNIKFEMLLSRKLAYYMNNRTLT